MGASGDIVRIEKEIIERISRLAGLYAADISAGSGADMFASGELARVEHRVGQNNPGPLTGGTLQRVFREIIAGAHAAVAPLTVAFLGPEGTFTNIAVKELFGESIVPLPQRTIQDVFRQVEAGAARYGVVPIENSTEGSVTYTLDELMETSLSIIAEKYVRITYSLLSRERDAASIRKIYSHPQTLGQCKGWIRANLPEAETISVDSTSRAAEMAAGEAGSAAISSEIAGEIYGLNTLATRIEDSRQNYTRFFMMGERAGKATGNDKTSIVCAVRDRPGALLTMLKPFSDAGINMTKIESRPDKKKMWAYNFFIDFLGHMDDGIVRETLDGIKDGTIFLKILGSYPAGS